MKLRDRYTQLLGWVDYIRGERNDVPGIGLRVPLDRAAIADTLIGLARARAGHEPTDPISTWAELPRAAPDRLFVGWNKINGLTIEIIRAQTWPDALLTALKEGGPQEPALLRLKLCPVCELPFLALHLAKARCAPCAGRVRQQRWYKEHVAGKGKRSMEKQTTAPEEKYRATRRLSRVRKRVHGGAPRSTAK